MPDKRCKDKIDVTAATVRLLVSKVAVTIETIMVRNLIKCVEVSWEGHHQFILEISLRQIIQHSSSLSER